MSHDTDDTQKNYTDWYNIWMKQSELFFTSANDYLKTIFNKHPIDPVAHMQQIEIWLEHLKKQWKLASGGHDHTHYGDYFEMMNKMMNDASELMLKQWIRRVKEHDPVNNVHDLYSLWLKCCHETYQKYMHSHDFQEAYGEFMNTLFKFWKSNIPG